MEKKRGRKSGTAEVNPAARWPEGKRFIRLQSCMPPRMPFRPAKMSSICIDLGMTAWFEQTPDSGCASSTLSGDFQPPKRSPGGSVSPDSPLRH
jgi:hypothetical protein